MTKAEFLSELQYSLEGRLPNDEVREIVADYSDIFDSNISEGKREESTALELGSPAKIARRILDDALMYTKEDKTAYPADKKFIDTKNLASLLKRVFAYVVDTLIGSLILVIIMFIIFMPFSTREIVTKTEGDYTSGATVSQHNNIYKSYTAKLYQDKEGLTTKVEVWDLSGKRLFKGSHDDFIGFLDKSGIRYPEDFKVRSYVTTVKSPLFQLAAVIVFLPYMMFFIFLGIGNIFNVIIAWKFKGYTIGKKLFNIKIEKVDRAKLTFADVLLRELVVKIIGNVITGGLLNVGSFIWACITNESKTVHDLAARTRVIKVKE